MVWLQYTTSDGIVQATNSSRVDDSSLAAIARAQIEYDGLPENIIVDITQSPPAVIPSPPPEG